MLENDTQKDEDEDAPHVDGGAAGGDGDTPADEDLMRRLQNHHKQKQKFKHNQTTVQNEHATVV